MIVSAHFRRFPPLFLPSYSLWNPRHTVLFCGIKYVISSHMFFSARLRQFVDSKHHKARGARLLPSDTIMQMALTIFGRAFISPVSILFPKTVAPPSGLSAKPPPLHQFSLLD